ncbi:hypothetical protein [Pontibaca methylaminivorans]|uniref:Uncharacterized protein n=1 Tax=Pontibaca methylaminivorans TaxID=515897 RepID=A0A1R3WVE6_9RHOB|nr:hypothetical protein [Pontibaca methylaminivorans]SIT82011.1 hypothetical protein SAMN05421849_1598 [Pontibaca methylaminivorans]
MRDFFILWLERIINIAIIIGAVAVFIAGLAAMLTGGHGAGMGAGFAMGIGIWIGGALYLVVIGGLAYLGLGIYNNTLRTANAVERLAAQGDDAPSQASGRVTT